MSSVSHEQNMLLCRFLEKVSVDDVTGCWNWTGAKQHYGYGAFAINRKPRGAHRVSYEMYIGPIVDGLYVCHRCDNPGCVNPEHLFLGTQSENIKDMMSKGRHARVGLHGIAHGRAKLSDADILEIRASAGSTVSGLAKRFGISRRQINRILSGAHWPHLITGASLALREQNSSNRVPETQTGDANERTEHGA